MDIYNKIEKSLLGLNSTDTKFAKELQEVKKYYEFYEGRPETIEDDTEDERGQLWKVKTDDYKPTREIRNITKKLMKKQKRFMTAVKPDFIIKSIDGADVERADNKKAIINKILNEGKFWNKFSKAFLDCTIGKRVMLCLITDIDDQGNVLSEKPIRFRFYTMPEFTYEYDPNDCDKLIKVQIAYQDETTIGKLQTEQRWHKWIYEMRGNECWATYQVVDGINTQAYIETVNENGEKVEGDAFAADVVKAAAEHQYPVFVANVDGQPKYIMALHGAGLWGPLWGYISVDSDRNTVYGADFSHQGETPGLGAEIAKPAFSNEFKGKKLFMDGTFKSIAVVKPGKSVAGQDYVDGISGGTITSQGVQAMLFNSLNGYVKFLTSQN